MLKLSSLYKGNQHSQRGVAVVEFAIIAILLFTLLFGILEFGRLFYVFNTVQEVTRRAAREAVVRWAPANEGQIKQIALFGSNGLPAGAEITAEKISIEYLNGSADPISFGSLPSGPSENIKECLSASAICVAFVKVSISNASYAPMVSLFPFLSIPIPASTVIMPAESMGYSG
jgi:hypothetical protein